MANRIKWTENHKQRIAELLREGKTYREISVELTGDTEGRNAIAGAVKRFKLIGVSTNVSGFDLVNKMTKAKTVKKQLQTPKVAIRRSKYTNQVIQKPKPEAVTQSVAEMMAQSSIDPAKFPYAVTFDQLTDLHCKWPIQDRPRLFCGATTPPRCRYCRIHQGNSRRLPESRITT